MEEDPSLEVNERCSYSSRRREVSGAAQVGRRVERVWEREGEREVEIPGRVGISDEFFLFP